MLRTITSNAASGARLVQSKALQPPRALPLRWYSTAMKRRGHAGLRSGYRPLQRSSAQPTRVIRLFSSRFKRGMPGGGEGAAWLERILNMGPLRLAAGLFVFVVGGMVLISIASFLISMLFLVGMGVGAYFLFRYGRGRLNNGFLLAQFRRRLLEQLHKNPDMPRTKYTGIIFFDSLVKGLAPTLARRPLAISQTIEVVEEALNASPAVAQFLDSVIPREARHLRFEPNPDDPEDGKILYRRISKAKTKASTSANREGTNVSLEGTVTWNHPMGRGTMFVEARAVGTRPRVRTPSRAWKAAGAEFLDSCVWETKRIISKLTGAPLEHNSWVRNPNESSLPSPEPLCDVEVMEVAVEFPFYEGSKDFTSEVQEYLRSKGGRQEPLQGEWADGSSWKSKKTGRIIDVPYVDKNE